MLVGSAARRPLFQAGFAIATLVSGRVLAQAPPEVQGVALAGSSLTWSATSGAASYNVYRGLASGLSQGIPGVS